MTHPNWSTHDAEPLHRDEIAALIDRDTRATTILPHLVWFISILRQQIYRDHRVGDYPSIETSAAAVHATTSRPSPLSTHNWITFIALSRSLTPWRPEGRGPAHRERDARMDRPRPWGRR